MNRLLTLASSGLFAAGLAILPVSVYAQPNAATNGTPAGSTGTEIKTDAKADAKVGAKAGSAAVVTHDSKVVKPSAMTSHGVAADHDAKTTPIGGAAGKDKGAAKATGSTAPVHAAASIAKPITAPAKAGG